MILKNAEIYDENFDLVKADIAVKDGKIDRVAPNLPGDESIDLTGCLITPGFVDIHIHGCMGADTCDGIREAVSTMAAHLVENGVTSFCPTTMTVSPAQIEKALSAAKDCMDTPPEGASVRGVNMEGPYISPSRRGAQKEEFVRKPDWQEFRRMFDGCGGIVKLVDVAPERDGAEDFIRHVSQYCRVSLAHTDADYEQAKASFDWGITHVTHLFNAMNG
ncbi:MAG TPA: amidohydrolase family protein, partial [Caproicibacter sp.]|nr:amidohydrolase family protein [Caproicibacter sp.]